MTSPSPSWPNFLSLCDCFLDAAAIGSMWWPREILLNDWTNRASVGTSGTPSHKWSNRHLGSLSRYPTSFCSCSISSRCPQLWIREPPSRIPCPSSLHTSFKCWQSCQHLPTTQLGTAGTGTSLEPLSSQEKSTLPAEMPMWIFYIRAASTWGETHLVSELAFI